VVAGLSWVAAAAKLDPVGLRCLIVDDSELFLAWAVRVLTAQGLQIVGTAGDSATALELAGSLDPDVAIVDIELGREDGVELAGLLPDATAVVLISAHDLDDVEGAIGGADVAGFLPKRSLSARAIEALLASR
jgi:DNA-binding NarL/FixJ family response regulator